MSHRVLDPVLLLVDANRVLTTICAKADYRSIETRTTLEEAVDAGMIRAFAPRFLLQEVDDEHLGRFVKPSRSLNRLQEARKLLLPRIELVDPPDLSSRNIEALRAVDPKDVPYAQAFEYRKLDTILSLDKHWKVTDYPVWRAKDHDIVKTLRTYARAASEEIGRTHFLIASAGLTVAAAKGVFDLVRRAPPALQAVLAVAAVLGVAHPKSREKLQEAVAALGEQVLPNISEFFAELEDKKKEREEAELLIARDLKPNPHRLTLKEHAYRILMKAQEPLDLDELERRIRAEGAKTRSKNLGPYLRRQMTDDQNFVEHVDGRWAARLVLTWPGIVAPVRFEESTR
ncbi:MAG: hypothetical protein EOP84_26505 [Verrucomicrobiaceae bacterium]|nr:MAG: hypothetical protein EOP84_26505 [Verrucomicrobiaceae bacterium]